MASTAPGLESGLQILEYISSNGGAGFNQMKTELGLSPGSLNRYLKTLIEHNFICKNENQQYVIANKLIEITKGINEMETIVNAVQPILEYISKCFGCTSQFIFFQRGRMICAAKYMIQDGFTMQNIGEDRTDYVVHPWGFILLASLEPKVRKIYIENANVFDQFKSCIPSRELQESFISEVLENGYCDDRSEILKNIRRISVPVYIGELKNEMVGADVKVAVNDREAKRLVGAICIGMPAGEYSKEEIENKIIILQKKSRELEN